MTMSNTTSAVKSQSDIFQLFEGLDMGIKSVQILAYADDIDYETVIMRKYKEVFSDLANAGENMEL